MFSQVIGPLPKVEANPLFTATFTCTALAAIVAGPIKREDGAHARIAPVEVEAEAKTGARGGRKLHEQLQETAEQSPEREPDQTALAKVRMPPVRLRIEPIAKRHAADDRADIEKARSHRRHAENIFRVQHSHDERGERDEEDEREHDPREQDREGGFLGGKTGRENSDHGGREQESRAASSRS